MIVLVCGGRDYADRVSAFTFLDWVHARHLVTRLVNGGASGGDELSGAWAVARGFPDTAIGRYPAAWDDLSAPGAVARRSRSGKLYNVRAGLERNRLMLRREGPDMVAALPGGRGTWDMMSIALNAGVPVLPFVHWRAGETELIWSQTELARIIPPPARRRRTAAGALS